MSCHDKKQTNADLARENFQKQVNLGFSDCLICSIYGASILLLQHLLLCLAANLTHSVQSRVKQ